MIDFETTCTAEDVTTPLTSDQADGIREAMEELKQNAQDGRVLLADDDGFQKKFSAFKRIYSERTGGDANSLPFFADDMVIGMVVNGTKGTGERGTVFSRYGIFITDKDFPWNDGKGDMPIGAIVPWKIFYIFGERLEGELGDGNYRLVKPGILVRSNKVSDEVREAYRDDMQREHGDKGMLFRFNSTGLDADSVSDFMDAVKSALREETEEPLGLGGSLNDQEEDEMLDEEDE